MGDPDASHTYYALKSLEGTDDEAGETAAIPEKTHELDPTEHIDLGIERIHASVAADLLARLHGNDPEFFEQAVLDLIMAMGYGGISFRRDGVSRTMSVHRFALLLAYGDDVADTVAEHRCNEPLCVRVDQEHVITSTQSANLRYAVSLGRAGSHRAPTGGRTRAERSLAVRDAIAGGWDPIAYARAAGETRPTPTPRLF